MVELRDEGFGGGPIGGGEFDFKEAEEGGEGFGAAILSGDFKPSFRECFVVELEEKGGNGVGGFRRDEGGVIGDALEVGIERGLGFVGSCEAGTEPEPKLGFHGFGCAGRELTKDGEAVFVGGLKREICLI